MSRPAVSFSLLPKEEGYLPAVFANLPGNVGRLPGDFFRFSGEAGHPPVVFGDRSAGRVADGFDF